MAADENTLLQKAIGGDRDALADLLEAVAPQVRAVLSLDRKWSSQLDVDDVMQVTYVEVFLQITRFQPGGEGSFLAWVRRIAQNNLRDAVKEMERLKRPQPEQRIQPAARDESVSGFYALLGLTTTTPSRVVAGNEMSAALEAALGSLPSDYAAVVRMYDLEGAAISDVAARLGRSPGAVHMLRSRAHDRLRDALAGTGQYSISAGG